MMRDGQYEIDRKEAWGEGPWLDELDYFVTEHPACIMVMRRTIRYGTWTGYIAIPPGHPWHGIDATWDQTLPGEPYVHGGITWAADNAPWHRNEDEWLDIVANHPENIPEEEPFVGIYGGDGWWWLGFDCSHAGDYNPGMAKWEKEHGVRGLTDGTYRDMFYVSDRLRELRMAALVVMAGLEAELEALEAGVEKGDEQD